MQFFMVFYLFHLKKQKQFWRNKYVVLYFIILLVIHFYLKVFQHFGQRQKSVQKSACWCRDNIKDTRYSIHYTYSTELEASRSKCNFAAGLGIRSFQMNGTIFAFFSILYKRTKRSFRSFPFFIKERNVLFAFISHTKIANLIKKERKKTQRSF